MEMDEVTQSFLGEASSRMAKAIVYIQAAHTSAGAAHTNGGPDFRDRIKRISDLCDGLFADIEEVAGPREPHRGLRIPPACEDAMCPVHGEKTSWRGYEDANACSTAARARTALSLHDRAGFD